MVYDEVWQENEPVPMPDPIPDPKPMPSPDPVPLDQRNGRRHTMKRLILVIGLLTAGMAFGHESENDHKHNAIHDSYVGKIRHAHSYGTLGAVQGDFHDHENAYQFGDDKPQPKTIGLLPEIT